jgi:hypothetical protein
MRGCRSSARTVSGTEFAESRALHTIGALLDDYPGIINRAVAGKVATVLHAAANELGNGRSPPPEVRRAIRCLADALRHDMQPPPDDLHATP